MKKTAETDRPRGVVGISVFSSVFSFACFFRVRKTLSHGMASRMSDLRVFQGQRRRRIRLGPQGDLKKNDNVQSLNTRWDETIFAMKTQPDKKMLDNFGYRQLQQAEQLKPLLSLYIEDTIQKGDSRDYTRLKKDGGPMLGTDNS